MTNRRMWDARLGGATLLLLAGLGAPIACDDADPAEHDPRDSGNPDGVGWDGGRYSIDGSGAGIPAPPDDGGIDDDAAVATDAGE